MSLHKRQRRGANIWQEPQEFAASGVAVDILGGDMRLKSKTLLRGAASGTPELSVRDAGNPNYFGQFKGTRAILYAAVKFLSGGSITTTSGGNIQLLPDAGGITKVGNATTTSHGLATNDDLLVTGDEEVVGDVFMDNLPTSDPLVAGQLYADSTDGYTVKQSQG